MFLQGIVVRSVVGMHHSLVPELERGIGPLWQLQFAVDMCKLVREGGRKSKEGGTNGGKEGERDGGREGGRKDVPSVQISALLCTNKNGSLLDYYKLRPKKVYWLL